ncbi:hypothetical protein DNTS_015406 [Danionella cerebrum]|uniref:N-glycosylase/DNA lyase n=1 Tax=Danionella cerebrum TaxID=2873325 RepID=A0A553R3T1_9TELE|nr:hypothetical protein DNTS_015406 [Danionella translucida]
MVRWCEEEPEEMSQHALLSAGGKDWRSLQCLRSELRLDLTLGCGQSFRWRETADGHWTGIMRGKVWTLTQTEDTLWYYVYKPKLKVEEEEVEPRGKGSKLKTEVKQEDLEGSSGIPEANLTEEDLLADYFQLGVQLGDLYRKWSAVDPHFKLTANIFTGVRLLRQDPAECLFSFICSSNNHISRIQGMVERLSQALGTLLCTLDDVAYHDFPTLQDMAGKSGAPPQEPSRPIVVETWTAAAPNESVTAPRVEQQLRNLGFGYRARFLQQSAQVIVDSHGPGWLQSLRSAPYLQARDALRTLPGVGLKVADCVCLMSLDKLEALPVDTHVWQIARRDYKFAVGSGQKTLTDRVYREIGDGFRKLWGPSAGWAHSVSIRKILSGRTSVYTSELTGIKDGSNGGSASPPENKHRRVLFCADLKKFQKLKEDPPVLKEKDRKRVRCEEKSTRKQPKI